VATGTTEETRGGREERKVHLHPQAPSALLSPNAIDPRLQRQISAREKKKNGVAGDMGSKPTWLRDTARGSEVFLRAPVTLAS